MNICGLGWLVPLVLLVPRSVDAGASEQRDVYHRSKKKPSSGGIGTGVGSLLHLNPTDSPHAEGFEPRPGIEMGGDLWDFGKVHAAVHHVLTHAPEGDPMTAVAVLEAFSTEHRLGFGLSPDLGNAIDEAVRIALASPDAAPAHSGAASTGRDIAALKVLVLGAGLGSATLGCLPALTAVGAAKGGLMHQVVSVEYDDELSGASSQLLSHAIGNGFGVPVDHTPLIPAEDTTLPEILESLDEGYGFRQFDLVLLWGSGTRTTQREQLQTLLNVGALRDPGGMVVAAGSNSSHGTEAYLDFVGEGGRGRFKSLARDLTDGGNVLISTLQSSASGSEL